MCFCSSLLMIIRCVRACVWISMCNNDLIMNLTKKLHVQQIVMSWNFKWTHMHELRKCTQFHVTFICRMDRLAVENDWILGEWRRFRWLMVNRLVFGMRWLHKFFNKTVWFIVIRLIESHCYWNAVHGSSLKKIVINKQQFHLCSNLTLNLWILFKHMELNAWRTRVKCRVKLNVWYSIK